MIAVGDLPESGYGSSDVLDPVLGDLPDRHGIGFKTRIAMAQGGPETADNVIPLQAANHSQQAAMRKTQAFGQRQKRLGYDLQVPGQFSDQGFF
jgi:hypothetical protein